MARSLPASGALVVAMTHESIEYDREPQEVRGVLRTEQSPFDGPPQCWVGDVQVNPESVREDDTEPG